MYLYCTKQQAKRKKGEMQSEIVQFGNISSFVRFSREIGHLLLNSEANSKGRPNLRQLEAASVWSLSIDHRRWSKKEEMLATTAKRL